MKRWLLLSVFMLSMNLLFAQLSNSSTITTKLWNNPMLSNPAMVGLNGTEFSVTRSDRYSSVLENNNLSNISFQTKLTGRRLSLGGSLTHDASWFNNVSAANIYIANQYGLKDGKHRILVGMTLGGYKNQVSTTLRFSSLDSIGQLSEVDVEDGAFTYNAGLGVMWLWEHGFVSLSVPRIFAPIWTAVADNGLELRQANQRDLFFSAGFLITPSQILAIRPAFTIQGVNFRDVFGASGRLIDVAMLKIGVDCIMYDVIWFGLNMNNSVNGGALISFFAPFDFGLNMGYRFRKGLRVGANVNIRNFSSPLPIDYGVELLVGYRFQNWLYTDPTKNIQHRHFF